MLEKENIGINLSAIPFGAALCRSFLLARNFSFGLWKGNDISRTIGLILHGKKAMQHFAAIDLKSKYCFGTKPKSPDAVFAILYDNVDAFVISGYEDLQEDIDPLLEMRIYNDNPRPVFLRVPDNILYEELDEIVAYSKLSSIDGLVISNPRLLKYSSAHSDGILSLIYDSPSADEAKIREALDSGADRIILPCRHTFPSLTSSKRLRKAD